MHVLHWILTGLIAGWLTGLVAGERRFGLLGDLTLGGLGAVLGGGLFRLLGVTLPQAHFSHFLIAAAGALLGTIGMRLIWRVGQRTVEIAGAKLGLENLDARFAALSDHERRVFARFFRREAAARDPSTVLDASLTLGQRAADRIARFGGSWPFLGIFALVTMVWMLFNEEWPRPFDPYPFILLNLVLSCLAAVQAPVILMSQNRQAEKDRLHAQLDYEVNLKAEIEILALHEKLDVMREKSWSDLVALQERQLALLDRIEQAIAERRDASV